MAEQHPRELLDRCHAAIKGVDMVEAGGTLGMIGLLVDAVRAWDREQTSPVLISDDMCQAALREFYAAQAGIPAEPGRHYHALHVETMRPALAAAFGVFCGELLDDKASLMRRAEAAEDALRDLASQVGNGGYNAPTVDAELFKAKVSDGIDTLIKVEGERRERAESELAAAKNRDEACKRILADFQEACEGTGLHAGMTSGEAIKRLAGERNQARADLQCIADALGMGDEGPTVAEMVAEIGRMNRDYAELSDTLEATKKDYQEYREQKTARIFCDPTQRPDALFRDRVNKIAAAIWDAIRGRHVSMVGVQPEPSMECFVAARAAMDRLRNDGALMAGGVIGSKREPPPLPEVEYYRHRNGTVYQLTGFEGDTVTGEIRCVYRERGHSQLFWRRPLEEWSELVKWPDGVMRPRFVPQTEVARG